MSAARPSSLVLSLLLAVGVVGMPAAPAFAADPEPPGDCPAVMPIDEVAAGQTGFGWTVVRGTEPRPFAVEVLGVYPDGILPDHDLILVRVSDTGSHQFIANARGIWAGMSGSPVYIDGRLVGSVLLRLLDRPVDARRPDAHRGDAGGRRPRGRPRRRGPLPSPAPCPPAGQPGQRLAIRVRAPGAADGPAVGAEARPEGRLPQARGRHARPLRPRHAPRAHGRRGAAGEQPRARGRPSRGCRAPGGRRQLRGDALQR